MKRPACEQETGSGSPACEVQSVCVVQNGELVKLIRLALLAWGASDTWSGRAGSRGSAEPDHERGFGLAHACEGFLGQAGRKDLVCNINGLATADMGSTTRA